MKECNYCKAKCHPSRRTGAGMDLLTSNLPCTKYAPIQHTFKFPDLISKVIIENPRSPVIKWIMEIEAYG